MAIPFKHLRESPHLVLVSHGLCPYVQRAAIVASEAGIAIERVVVDLANKPEWFLQLSPTGKVPLLLVGEEVLFESASIAEFLNEISEAEMLPADPVDRARHRAWIEFASGTLAQIAGLYSAADRDAFEQAGKVLSDRLATVGSAVAGPWFGGPAFGLVDAAFAPVFRYLDTFESEAGISLMRNDVALLDWRRRLSDRPSVRHSVARDYSALLRDFLLRRGSYISQRLIDRSEIAA